MPPTPQKIKKLEVIGDCRNCPFAEEHEDQVHCLAKTKRPKNQQGEFFARQGQVVGTRPDIICSECNGHKAWGEIEWRDLNELRCPLPDAE